MNLRCPQCRNALEVEQIRIAALVQCPICGAAFRADEGAPRFPNDDVIDVHAEVLSPEADPVETPEARTPEVGNTPSIYTARPDNVPRERIVYIKHVIRKENEGCGCGGCGCLVLLFLLLFLLFGCAATAII